MKKNCAKTNTGSVLVGAMALILAIAGFLYCYLYIVKNSTQSTARAQRWNSALTLAESGVEAGLANLNSTVNNFNSSNPLFSPSVLTNNLAIGGSGNYIGSF